MKYKAVHRVGRDDGEIARYSDDGEIARYSAFVPTLLREPGALAIMKH
jgi:hypothetical protein